MEEEDLLVLYGVISCSYDVPVGDNTHTKIIGYQLREYWASYVSKNGDIYTIEGEDGNEHTGTIEEFFEGELRLIFGMDVCWEDEKFVIIENTSEVIFDKEVYDEWPHPEDDDYDTKWHMEHYFKNKEDALIKMKELIERRDLY
jgi:hypothetical protein